MDRLALPEGSAPRRRGSSRFQVDLGDQFGIDGNVVATFQNGLAALLQLAKERFQV